MRRFAASSPTSRVSRNPLTMFERLFGTKEQDPAIAGRIPPGQYKTDKFPVLHYGSVPHTDLATWDFKVWGEVDSPFTLTWEQFKGLPRKTVNTDIHCVTRWTKLDTTWEGVPIQTILKMAAVRPNADHVVSHAEPAAARDGAAPRPAHSGSSMKMASCGPTGGGASHSSSSTATRYAS